MKISMIGQKGIPARQGGVEHVVDQLATELAHLGHSVDVYCRKSYMEPGSAATVSDGIQRLVVPGIATKHLDALTHTFNASAHAAYQKPDIIHFHAIGPALFSSVPRLRGIPIVTTVHGLDWMREKWGKIAKAGLKICEKVMVACSDEIIVVSPTLKAYLEKNYGVDSTFIPNGVTPLPDADAGLLKKYGIGDKKFFLCVARLVPEKGLHFAVKALSSGLDIDLVIAGESGFGDDYAKHLRASAGPHVKFIGHADRHALAALYKRAEALLVPSTVEGMPLVVLEAMSAGCAVLASDIPELKAAAGDCSFYFRSENSEDLRLQIDRFLADDKGKSEKIKLGLSRSKDYNWANITTKTLSVYERAVTRAKR